MNGIEKAERFAALHVKGTPIRLYNAWDAGSAKAIVAAGAKAVATSSWAVADAQGFRDGEDIPVDFVERIVGRVATAVDVPVTVDFEGGYTDDDGTLSANVTRLLDLGIVGINFEDRIVKGDGLHDKVRQARRISLIRHAAEVHGVNLFINARTDLFLGREWDPVRSIDEAIERAAAYAAAGASGFFIPGLTDETLIGRICEAVSIPVNVMMMEGVPPVERLARIGVARLSYGAGPYAQAMATLGQEARTVLA
ncbi:isocitrate lyase/phosphoenolpyruvate mutase family protein [Methylobacterium sp. J-048]|uniref:isocitrate lyase/PEP mutase family protein n=1 Tax=Methylobacterium sp. J-048 TaxID=2836635 RepID=UPI001FBB934A|nr:isocitrate lyase/phosphoenolpyruvate mutase family protein [Methylobacterium sp. J-048]MCJ2058514.1 isocitrate lyase/phosphoenolpyruvate mutase family protein [Methylobacterium sp. J-048]